MTSTLSARPRRVRRPSASHPVRRAVRLVAVNLLVGVIVAGLDLAGYTIVARLLQDRAALMLNCAFGACLSVLALHPAGCWGHRRLVRALARDRFGRLLLALTSSPRLRRTNSPTTRRGAR
jgi:hypothetical protein